MPADVYQREQLRSHKTTDVLASSASSGGCVVDW